MPGPTERLARQSSDQLRSARNGAASAMADDAVVHCSPNIKPEQLVAGIGDRLKRVGLRLNRDDHEGGRLLHGRSAAARRRAFRRNMISGQMRRWRRHRRIWLTQPFLLQAHVK